MMASSANSGVYGTRVIIQELDAGIPDSIEEAQRALATSDVSPPVTDQERSDFVEAHNDARGAVGVAPLQWDDKHEEEAGKAVNLYFPQACLINSAGGESYGENIFCGIDSATPPQWTPRSAVNDWVLEKGKYDYNSNSCNPPGSVCDHYKQVVNKNTTKLGCAIARQASKMLVVCKYTKKATADRPY
ncbi:hypothetical protein CBR_g48505 [Chara braunii]|uniref:SCP domain-containing protein n=1 Tax=Chara braunii TaxID=69332 RepID=A0A388M351_CHABU|nr:hypothetical protein CBR_g48505 [Chara braunii]|eukprot:GBG88893.1 hypothetical protein CBR_g48505 [Chara braunii]